MTRGAADRLTRAKEELDRLPPLCPRALRALADWYEIELTYTSNASEGSTLTRSETALVLEKGSEIAGKPLKDQLEALAHREAWHFIRILAAAGGPVREGDIREVHRLISVRTDPEEAGRYARDQRIYPGSSLELPTPAEIPALMEKFAVWLAAAPGGPEIAFAAHARLLAIHPFTGGNGRIARLLMNLLLIRADCPPLVIAPEHRAAYIDALRALQLHNDPAPHRDFMTERLAASLDRHLAMLRRTTNRPIQAPT
jgi:Fic family protein